MVQKKFEDAEMQAEYEDWDSWAPDLIEAVELGYLDDRLSSIMQAIAERRKTAGIQLKVRRPLAGAAAYKQTTPQPGSHTHSIAPQPAGLVAGPQVPQAFFPKSDTQSILNATQDTRNFVISNGEAYRKYDVMRTGLWLDGRGEAFKLRNARKFPNAEYRVVKLNRSRAEVEIVRDMTGRGRPGMKMTVPIGWLIESMRDYTATIDTTAYPTN